MRKAIFVIPVLLLFFVSFVSAYVVEYPPNQYGEEFVDIVSPKAFSLFSVFDDVCGNKEGVCNYYTTSYGAEGWRFYEQCSVTSSNTCNCKLSGAFYWTMSQCLNAYPSADNECTQDLTKMCDDGINERVTLKCVDGKYEFFNGQCPTSGGTSNLVWCLKVYNDGKGVCEKNVCDFSYTSEANCESVLGLKVYCLKADKSSCYQSGDGVCNSGEVRFEDQTKTSAQVMDLCNQDVVDCGTSCGGTSSSSGGSTSSGGTTTSSSSSSGGTTTTSSSGGSSGGTSFDFVWNNNYWYVLAGIALLFLLGGKK